MKIEKRHHITFHKKRVYMSTMNGGALDDGLSGGFAAGFSAMDRGYHVLAGTGSGGNHEGENFCEC